MHTLEYTPNPILRIKAPDVTDFYLPVHAQAEESIREAVEIFKDLGAEKASATSPPLNRTASGLGLISLIS